MEKRYIRREGPINNAFGLTYASFVVLPRTVLMDMPIEWQEKFIELMDELNDTFDYEEKLQMDIEVSVKKNNKYAKMPEWIYKYRHPQHKDILEK